MELNMVTDGPDTPVSRFGSQPTLKEDPTIWFFWAVLIVHVVLWTFLPAITQPNVSAETLELLSLGSRPAWGYIEQPPLAAWLTSAFCAFSAPSVWPAFLLAQLATAVCFWAAWKMARLFLHPWTALCAAIALEGCYFFSLTSPAATSGHIARAFWALAVLSFYHALTEQRRRNWVLTGVFLGLGMLTHYGTALLFVAMVTFTVLNSRARRCWDSSWPFLGIACMLGVMLPHILWSMGSGFPQFEQGTVPVGDRAVHLVTFGFSQVLALIPVLILVSPMISWFDLEEKLSLEISDDDDQEFLRRMLLMVTVLPAGVMFAGSITMGVSLTWLSGTPLWTFAGVLLLSWSHLTESRDSWRRVILRSASATGAFAALLVVFNVMMPEIRQQATSVHYPGKQLASQAEKLWSDWYESRLTIVGGDPLMARNVSWYGASHPYIYTNLDPKRDSSLNDSVLMTYGGIIVWDYDREDAFSDAELYERFSNVLIMDPVEIKWQTNANIAPVRVGMALVHPQQTDSPVVTLAE